MHHALIHLSLVPMRSEATDKAEISSYLLFGDAIEVLKRDEKWSFVVSIHDNYHGWIDNKQYTIVEEEELNKVLSQTPTLVSDMVVCANNSQSGETLLLTMGATLPYYEDGKCRVGGQGYEILGNVTQGFVATDITILAHRFLGVPYLWGGRSPFGIDCSGYIQLLFKMVGCKLPRDAYQQAKLGEYAHPSNAMAMDLAFFANAEGRITHVGLMLDSDRIIHASGKVRIDKFDAQGIYNEEIRGYSHRFHSLRKLILK